MPATMQETLVAMQTEQGFRVYAPSDPARTYTVSGTADVPDCDCPEFAERIGEDPDFRCRHILAVESQLPQSTPLDDEDREERRAIQNEGTAQPAVSAVANPGAQMTIKRSASPDGRIDSLSVELTCPVEGLTVGTIKAKAAKTIRLQDEIVTHFLADSGNGADAPENGNGHAVSGRGNGGNGRERNGSRNGPVAARMIDVQGMQTRYGWRMFINIESAGQTYKLFGTRRDLSEAIANAGYPDLSRNLASGTELNIPCRVTFKRSEDNRYQNVDEVFAAENGERARGRR